MDNRESKPKSQLLDALDATDAVEKNYHIRQALQLLMVPETEADRSSTEAVDHPTTTAEGIAEHTD
ncbi:hypothetical protein ACFR97_08410 [Haloplanus litoreus]|uniref:Uncharacterized protein n=1 Tax=Haloplanus litoreus TaxID=767515 RepID=A0ABD5ZV93_9EURY